MLDLFEIEILSRVLRTYINCRCLWLLVFQGHLHRLAFLV